MLCPVCQISEWDTAGFVWTERHQQRGTPPCDPALAAHERLLYLQTLATEEEKTLYSAEDLDSLCPQCGITAADTEGHLWYGRHVRSNRMPACEPSRAANARYERARRAARGPLKRKARGFKVPAEALCADCGITRDDISEEGSSKFYQRHRTIGTPLCEWGRLERSRGQRRWRKTRRTD